MKQILITGSNKGIGFEISRQLAKLGHHVILSGRDSVRLQQAKEKLLNEGLSLDAILIDTSDENSIRLAAEQLHQKNIKLDVLVNNAAILVKSDGHILHDDQTILEQTLNVNALGILRVCKYFLPTLSRPSRIINISSGGGSMSDPVGGWSPAYCVSKSLLNAITRQVAFSLKSQKISVNAVDPGWVRTDMGGSSAPRNVEEGADTAVWLATTEKTPTGKFFRDRREINW